MGTGVLSKKERTKKKIIMDEKTVSVITREMLSVVLSESESIIRKVLANIVTAS